MCVPKAANTMEFSEQKAKYAVCCQPQVHFSCLKQLSTQIRKRISKLYINSPLLYLIYGKGR